MNELLLIVTIAGQRVALPADAVESVVELDTLIPVPRAAPHVAGLSALRSRVLTVIDCMRSLELGATDCADGVREAAVATTVVINIPDTTLVLGEKVQCTVEVRDQFDEPMGLQVAWRSTNKNTVAVSSSGLITAKLVGSSNIYAVFGTLQSIRIPVVVQ